MAKPSPELIQHLRKAAQRLSESKLYQWGHMGACNCGFLAQEISKLTKAEIHRRAMQRYGDWNEQVDDYCPTSGLPMDELISEMINAGLDRDDLKKLEKLSDENILKRLPVDKRHLIHNKRDDVVLYIRAFADMLEEQLLEKISLQELQKNTRKLDTVI